MSFLSRIEEFHASAYARCAWNDTDSRCCAADFGDSDYLQAMQQYCSALDKNRELTEIGKLVIERQISDYLRGRLYSEHFKHKYPDYAQQKIRKPIFIIGLPRSGTTALHKILAADPANQSLSYWLGKTPMPRPPEREWEHKPEFSESISELEMMGELAPNMLAIHRMAADEADECRHLLLQSFANVTLLSGSAVPEYERWLESCDFRPVYAHYRDNLKLIGLGNDARWVLKDPSHLWAPQTLLNCFPDACIVQTHRHPKHLIPSVASLVHASCSMMAPERDKKSVGQREFQQWLGVLNNMTAMRRRNAALKVYDLKLEEFQNNPFAAVEDIYAYFEIPFDSASKDAVKTWIKQHPSNAQASHQYSAAEFGLREKEITKAFSEYIEYFELEN